MLHQLVMLGDLFCAERKLSRARLGTIVAGNSKFFDQIDRDGGNCTIATFQRVLSFFRDGANWPEGRIPQAAVDLLDNFANIATGAGASSGKALEITEDSPAGVPPAKVCSVGDEAGAEAQSPVSPRASAPADGKQEAA